MQHRSSGRPNPTVRQMETEILMIENKLAELDLDREKNKRLTLVAMIMTSINGIDALFMLSMKCPMNHRLCLMETHPGPSPTRTRWSS